MGTRMNEKSYTHPGRHEPRAGGAQSRQSCVLYGEATGSLLGEVFKVGRTSVDGRGTPTG